MLKSADFAEIAKIAAQFTLIQLEYLIDAFEDGPKRSYLSEVFKEKG